MAAHGSAGSDEMKVLVTGRSGQVAGALAAVGSADPGRSTVCLGRPELDITDEENVRAALRTHRPGLVVNTAAFTDVDGAEDNAHAAFAVNAAGAGIVAAACAEAGIPVIHISTDYVFSGEGRVPYQETDPVRPLCVYGRSKLAGEEAVAEANPRHVILRTAWIYGPDGRNFLTSMLRNGAGRDELRVVGDQTGSPTHAVDFAAAIHAITRQVAGLGDRSSAWGLYHLTNAGMATRHEFAREIFRVAEAEGYDPPRLTEITSSQYPTRAERPIWSVLDNSRVAAAFGIRMRDWRLPCAESVRRFMREASGD